MKNKDRIIKGEEDNTSPMIKHYLAIKEQYNDCIIFYRLGDFYEMFFEDAVEASQILDLTLTGRDCGRAERAPMCGVPYHAADTYIAKLVAKGKKVAICEQLTPPGQAKLVDRGVIKIVTPGTLTEDSQIVENKNNYILAVFIDKQIAAAWADITTGEFYVREISGEEDLYDTLSRIAPSEVITNPQAIEKLRNNPLFTRGILERPQLYKEYAFNFKSAAKTLMEQFNVLSLDGFGLSDKPCAVCASGALVEYLKETQMHALVNINAITLEMSDQYILLDGVCLRNLELVSSMRDGKEYGTLLWVLDQTKTAMGARKLRSALIAPLRRKQEIDYRLNAVSELYESLEITNAIRDTLCACKDIERISGKISNAVVTPRDLENLRTSLEIIPNIKFRLSGLSSQALVDINRALVDMTKTIEILKSAITDNPPVSTKEGGYIRDGFDEELDKLRNIQNHGKELLDKMEEEEREKTGIKNLRISYNKVFGYYIEVTNSFKDKVPLTYIRRQTLTNAERYITEELKQFEDQILTASSRSLKIEQDIFDKILGMLSASIGVLKRIARAIASLDVLCDFAFIAKKNKYVRPEIVDEDLALDIVGGRHPVIERVSSEQFIANDTLLDNGDNSMMIITGPNMAGKSTYMRQVALITIMAQCGCFVPAKSARIPVVDRVFTRVGASDNLILDQSTFMVEMSEVALILRSATKNSLLILDEVGRGTSTYDGLSIAWAVVEYISKNLHAKTLFATHYHELSELEGVVEGIKNYKITVKEINNSIVFLRKIMRGSANRSFGIEVAALAGVPAKVTDRAKAILKRLEKNDLAKGGGMAYEEQHEESVADANYAQIINIIKELDVDGITPRQAFDILVDLKTKVENKD